MRPLRIGLVGCGYVADFYRSCIAAYPAKLRIAGVFDTDGARARNLGTLGGFLPFESYADMLRDPGIDLVLNLTPPAAHFAVSICAIEAGKHVISEKPLAARPDQARMLFDAAAAAGTALGCAPFVARSPAARRLRQRMRAAGAGPVSHLYLNLDDGPLHRLNCERWIATHGAAWPAESEFGLGPIVHHAPYALAWAIAIAGPVRRLSGAVRTSVQVKRGHRAGPDIALCTLEHRSGAIARLTVGALASRDRSLTVVCRNDEFSISDMLCADAAVRDGAGGSWGAPLPWPYENTHRINFHQGLLDLQAQLSRYGARGAASFRDAQRRIALPITEMIAAMAQPGPVDLSLPEDS